MEVYEYLFPNIDFSRVSFFDGIPSILDRGQEGITIASVGLSSEIKVYLEEGLYDPCNYHSFLLIAHELVHVLQIQDSIAGGWIPGWWTFKYVACWVGWFGSGADCENEFEEEAYKYANGCPPLGTTNRGELRTCLELAKLDGLPPCDCSNLPWYRRASIPHTTTAFFEQLKISCPDLVKRESNASSWKCLLNPIALVIGLVVGALSIFGLTGVSGAVGSGIGALGGAALGAYWGALIGSLVGGLPGLIIGAIIGAIVGFIVGAIVGGAVGSAIEWLIDAITSSPKSWIWLTLHDRTEWMIPDVPITQNGHTKTSAGPALVVYNGKLYMAYKGSGSDDLWYNYFGGTNWLAQDIKITNDGHTKTSAGPALAVYNGKLYMAYKGSGSDDLWYNYFDGTNWLAQDVKITNDGHTKTSAGPALAGYDGKLYMAYKGSGSDDLWYNYFDGTKWLAQDIKITKYGSVKTARGPALGDFAGSLFLVYRDNS